MKNVIILSLLLLLAGFSIQAQEESPVVSEKEITAAKSEDVSFFSNEQEEAKPERKRQKTTTKAIDAPNRNSRVSGKFWTQIELEEQTKMDLTEIYLEKVSIFNMLLPYIVFNQEDKLAPADLIGVKVPDGKSNLSSLEKIKDQTQKHNELYLEELAVILPYSDKEDMIRGILFVQRSIAAISDGAY